MGLASVISNCNRFSFTVAFVTLEKEPTVLQRIEIRLTQASEKGSKSVGRSNCVANEALGRSHMKHRGGSGVEFTNLALIVHFLKIRH